MSETSQAVLSSWSLSPGLTCGLVALLVVYARGWRRLNLPPVRFAAMAGGLGALVLAIASPIDALASFLLAAHMLQHMLLLVVAPPLILFGAPERALLRGLPPLRDLMGPLLASKVMRLLTQPLAGVVAIVAATWAWHLPPVYELALRSPVVHGFEHACFFSAALLFWWPVVHARRARWSLIPCLLLVDAQNTALSALLVFSDHVLYSSYASAPRLFNLSALEDQVIAGTLMWVPGSLVFLGAAIVSSVRWLSPPAAAPERTTPKPVPFDLLRAPIVGRLLRARYGRRLLQWACFSVAVLLIVDGLRGPPAAPMNLAGLVPWIWWRALTVVALLAAGNFFCMACPFTLPRELGRRLGLANRSWPRALRGKWLAILLLIGFFVAQEQLGWWNAPRATAILAIAYFVAAFVIDSLVRGASFCKYVCPIGQFQFVGSLISPLEVKVRLPVVCADCDTRDCLRGNSRQRGCELDLYLPRKVGNLDCTFCLDCVKACPHDNIGILAATPGRTLWHRGLWRRSDVAVLSLVVVVAAFAVAAAMVTSMQPATLVLCLLLVASLLLVGRLALGGPHFNRLALALVPLGMGMWAAHLAFHLATSWRSIIPVVRRVLGGGAPAWSLACAGVASDWLVTFELLLLDAGLLASLYFGRRTLTFAAFAFALWLAGVWIVFSPMQMRGM